MTRRSLLGLLLNGILLAAVLTLTACGGQPAAAEATPDMNLTVAAGAQTMVAAVFQTQTAIAPPPTDTPLPTPTSLPTLASTPLTLPTIATVATQAVLFAATPTPTGTFYTSTPLASSLSAGCLNLRLIKSWTEPSGQLKPGTEFTQYWQVENNGTCEWLFVFQLVHVSGDKMGGSPGRFGNKIFPGKWTTFSVGLKAPNDNGKYNATWRFSDGGGTMFGASLPVSIEVKKNPDPTATPNVLQTAAAGTVAVQLTATAQQAAIIAGQTAAAAATQTAQAAATATPTLAPTATPTATPTP